MKMLSSISAENLKGQKFDQPLEKLNLFVGPNGSGKSARAAAVSLLLLGYIPGIGKQPGAIMDEIGTGDKVFVSGVCGDEKTHLLRRIARNANGSTSVDMMINRKKATKDKFIDALARAPKVLDLSVFLELSDQKKIEYLLDLFPASGDLAEVDAQLATLTEKKNAKTAEKSAKDALVSLLANAQASIQRPAGTLPEIQQDIQRTSAEYKLTRDNIERARQEQATKAAAEAATKAAEEKALKEKAAAEEAAKQMPVSEPAPPPPVQETVHTHDEAPLRHSYECPVINRPLTAESMATLIPHLSASGPAHSISRIIAAMDQVCESCAAKIIAKVELRKYVEKEMKF
jgi:exonuclease SbcC